MIRIQLGSANELDELPDGTILTSDREGDRLTWSRTYRRPHADPDTGLWTLPRNPFVEWGVAEIYAELPDVIDSALLTGREPWLSTLDDPHDTTHHH